MGLTIVHMFDEQGVINAWNSVIFRSKVGSAILALTSVAILVGGIRSIQNKSSNKILAAISTCFFINVGLLLTTFAGWRRAGINILEMQNSSRLAFEGIVIKVNSFRDEVLRDGLKAVKYYSGSMAVFSRDELIGILQNLKGTYKEVWDRGNPVPNSLGEFLSKYNVLEKNFRTLPETHPFKLAIEGMYDVYGEMNLSSQYFKAVFVRNLSCIVEKDDDRSHNANVGLLRSFDFPSLNHDRIYAYKCRVLERVYDKIIQALGQEKQPPNWQRFCQDTFHKSYISEFFEQSFSDICLGKDPSFVDWLRGQIKNLSSKTMDKDFLSRCFNQAMPESA
jgi:hypothetical protein